MSAKDSLSWLSPADFFAVLVPGFYVVCTLSLFLLPVMPIVEGDRWLTLTSAVSNLSLNWGILALLLSYLIGSMARALPVLWPDRLSGIIGRGILRQAKYYEGDFPYGQMLGQRLAAVGGHAKFKIQPLPADCGELHSAFNFWKAVVCRRSPRLFNYIEPREARVRMFAGILWATAISLVLGIVQWLLPSMAPWWPIVLTFWLVSLFVFVVFLLRLRDVRKEEAAVVFYSYLAVC